MKSYDIQKVAEKIGVPVTEWPGRCFEIARALVAHGVVKGQAVYGHWIGPVSPDAPVFGSRCRLPFQRHGWARRADGTVVDPTRWVFENAKPYIFVGKASESEVKWPYDEGGDQWRRMTRSEPPVYEESEAVEFELSEVAWESVTEILGHDGFSLKQVMWLANMPYEVLDPHVVEVYSAIAKLPCGLAFIPIDNVKRAEREYGVTIRRRK